MAAGGAIPVFKINDFFEKAEEISKFVSPENQAKYQKGLILLRSAWAKASVPTLRKTGIELADYLPTQTNKKSVEEVKQVIMSLHEHKQAEVSTKERGIDSSQGHRSSISSPSHGSETLKLTGRNRKFTPSSSRPVSTMSDESFSLNTKGTTTMTDARTDKKDTKRTIENIEESRYDPEIEDDLEALLKTLEIKLIREQIDYRKITFSNKETRKQRCKSHIYQIEDMFDGVIAAFDDLGMRLLKKKEEIPEDGMKGVSNKEIRQLKEQLETKENGLQAILKWIEAADAYVSTGDLSGDKKMQDVAKILPKEFQDGPLKLSKELLDNATKLKRIEEWIDAITGYALTSNDERPILRGVKHHVEHKEIMDDLLDVIGALKVHRKKSHILEKWIDTFAIGAEYGARKVPRFECPPELQEECSKIKKTLESVSQIHISSKDQEDELEHLEAEILNWSKQSKLTGSKCKTQSANRIRQCRYLIYSRKADTHESIERYSDLVHEIKALAKDFENWEEVQNLQKFGKDTSSYLRDLRNARILISRKKQDNLRIIKSFREEISSFENDLKHWSDLREVQQNEGLESEFCVALRRLRAMTFKRKENSYIIAQNMRIAEDELKQLKFEVSKWEQLEPVDKLQNPHDFPLALDVNEIRIDIVNIKKLHQENIQIFEAKMKYLKSLCNYIMDDEVKPKRGERTLSEEPDAKACISCIRRWKEGRQQTQLFVEEIVPLLQSSLIRLKSEPYSFHEPKIRTDVKLYSVFFEEFQLLVYQLVDYIEFNGKRVSKAAGAKLRENYPYIDDLSDPNTRTKLSERYSELYDNQWTNTFEKLTAGKRCTEKRAIDSLLEIFKEAFLFCTDISNTQTHLLKSTILCPVQGLKSSHIGANDQQLSSEHAVMISELRKGTVDDSIIDLQNHFKKKHADFADSKTEIFTDECVRFCWMMCVQSPPLWVDFQTKSDDSLNKHVYKSYTATGPKVDYVVWPALYLLQGGGLLMKGVAQGKASRK